ncbi:MAG: polysaccharide deacetylase family protein [Kiritimatiellae bacterium]|nr:polysaccharide deacetylase family protein [Kiritimatiellia bacterium]
MSMRNTVLFLIAAGLLAAAGCRPTFAPVKQVLAPGETAHFVPNKHKMIALTFDDGPNGAATEQILNALRESSVKASFFILGANAERHPQLARRIAAEGHLIGNHTQRHSRFDLITKAEIEKDIADGNKTIEMITGVRPRWFRPPFGINGRGLAEACRRHGLRIAGWSLDANDWNPHPVEELVDAIVSRTVAGDIILLHDGWETNPGADRRRTAAAASLILDKLKAAGFVFVTLPELLRHAGPPAAVFENGVCLLGMQVPRDGIYAGDRFAARYFWDVPANYRADAPKAFVHFSRPGQSFLFQDDHFLHPPGDVRDLVVRNIIHVPGNAPAGRYEINIGLFYPDKPEGRNRLKARSGFPQSKRAVHMPTALNIAPAEHKPNQGP